MCQCVEAILKHEYETLKASNDTEYYLLIIITVTSLLAKIRFAICIINF